MPPESKTSESTAEMAQLRALAQKFNLDLITAVDNAMLAADLAADLPVEWARTHLMLPIRRHGQPVLLLNDPTAISAQKHLELLLNRELPPMLAPQAVIMNAIERSYFSRTDTAREFLRDLDELAPAENRASPRSDDLLQVIENAPITQLINLILLEAIKANASDIHVEPFESRMRIRYRIDGVLYEQTSPPKHLEPALISRLKVMAHMDISEKRLPQDGVARVRIGEREIDIRASSIPVAEGERVVLRLLNRNTTVLPLAGLGLSATMLTAIDRLLMEPNGIIIVSGPTGSGKTTTLYAALQQLNKSRLNILTIEDPIEYQLPDIGQIQVKPKIGLTFADGLRHILRQDPDTILVGEIRDLETAEIAVRASLTGHLVFTTLHTNDAPSAVIRMIDMGVEPYLLAACLRAVLAQRLTRRLCAECRKPATLTEAEISILKEAHCTAVPSAVWSPQGCPACLEGYKGRTGLFELMIVNADIADAIRVEHPNSQILRSLAIRSGMATLLDDGAEKLGRGLTSFAELLRTIGRAAY
ncbi:MAG: ATPase, T2SS/T4P/T4SS family [Kiritimatiellae bacterium]|nr:ATPase, T2SS/T4P/T4SS family [Kiritimatiellia bacterium]